jgi:hypothetical protein
LYMLQSPRRPAAADRQSMASPAVLPACATALLTKRPASGARRATSARR